MKNLKDLQKNWNVLGKNDPLWAVLTDPDKKGGKWEIDDFFETGVSEINEVIDYIESLGLNVLRRKALDFGCAVGRLTQALSLHFEEVIGVDIAPSMIELAKRYNRHGGKCKYFLNENDDLKLFLNNSFDLIYSNITLQHIEPRYSKNYIKEFLRVLAPQGLLIFQLPCKPESTYRIKRMIPTFLLDVYCRIRFGGKMEMYGVDKDEIVSLLKENGAKILDIKQNQNIKGWISYNYCVTKE